LLHHGYIPSILSLGVSVLNGLRLRLCVRLLCDGRIPLLRLSWVLRLLIGLLR
jgi:hypothetical protein